MARWREICRRISRKAFSQALCGVALISTDRTKTEMISMKKTKKMIAMITALCCMACATACGSKSVPNSLENEQDGFVITGGEASNGESSEGEDDDTIKLVPRTTAAIKYTDTPDTATTVTGSNASLLTRSKEELDRLNNNKKTKNTAKPSNGNKATSAKKSTQTVTSAVTTAAATTTAPSAPSITLSYTKAEIIVGQTKEYPLVSESISEIWTTSDANVATVDQYGNITGVGEGKCVIRVTDANNKNSYGEVEVTVTKPQGIQQIDGVTYIDGVLIANKTYALPSTYNPGGLTSETYNAFQSLAQGAANDGLNIYISSGFRSYETQEQIYNTYVANNGQATADTFSARPGHSEHQTGLAIDVNEISDAFIGTPEAIWLEEHCAEYGFIIRYPQGKQGITGYKYEPWHIRYVGKDVAQAIKDTGAAIGDPYLTMEEYFGINSIYQ